MSNEPSIVCVYPDGEVSILQGRTVGKLQPSDDGSKWWMGDPPRDVPRAWWVLIPKPGHAVPPWIVDGRFPKCCDIDGPFDTLTEAQA